MPGTDASPERFAATVASAPLDRDRPLWEMHLIDGLADESIHGSVAVVTKLHHAVMDGGAGAEIMASLFDLEPDVVTPAPEDDWMPEQLPTRATGRRRRRRRLQPCRSDPEDAGPHRHRHDRVARRDVPAWMGPTRGRRRHARRSTALSAPNGLWSSPVAPSPRSSR